MANRAVAGTRSDQILSAVKTNWSPNSRGIVGIAAGLFNDSTQYGDTTGTTTAAEAFRSIFEYLTARARVDTNSVSWGFSTGDWTAGASSTVTAEAYLTFTGDAVVLLVEAATGAGGTLLVENETGTDLATITTGGYKQAFTKSVRLTGFGAGTHSIRLTLTAGSATITGALIPGDTPPMVVWLVPPARAISGANNTLTASYVAAVTPVADSFGVFKVTTDGSWSTATMIGPDQGHPNDLGNSYLADLIDKAVRATDPQIHQGLNQLTQKGASAAYTAPAMAYPGADVPPPTVTYAVDSFNRADTTGGPGTTEVGGYTWSVTAGDSFEVASNRLKGLAVATAPPDCLIDDGQADGTISLTLPNASTNGGIAFRISADRSTGYVFYNNISGYSLRKRTAAGTYVQLVAGPTGANAPGDVLSVVLSGSSIVCKVNGTAVITTTDSSFTGTRHGAVIFAANQSVDSFSHTSATT